MPWTPPASPITWQDFPNLSTAVSAAHLNQAEGYASTVGQSVADYVDGGTWPPNYAKLAGVEPYSNPYTLYVNQLNGSDTNLGNSPGQALQTLTKAISKLQQSAHGGRIVIYPVSGGNLDLTAPVAFVVPCLIETLVPYGASIRRAFGTPNGRSVWDAVTTAAGSTVTSATAAFTNADNGVIVEIYGAGTGGGTYYDFISGNPPSGTTANLTATTAIARNATTDPHGVKMRIVGDWNRVVTDAGISANASVITSVSAAFTVADIGTEVVIAGAGQGGQALRSAIVSVSGNTATIIGIATNTVSTARCAIGVNFGTLFTWHGPNAGQSGTRFITITDESGTSNRIGSAIDIIATDQKAAAQSNPADFSFQGLLVTSTGSGGAWEHIITSDGSWCQNSSGPGIRRGDFHNLKAFGARRPTENIRLVSAVHWGFTGRGMFPSPTSVAQGIALLDPQKTAGVQYSTADVNFTEFEGVGAYLYCEGQDCFYNGGRVAPAVSVAGHRAIEFAPSSDHCFANTLNHASGVTAACADEWDAGTNNRIETNTVTRSFSNKADEAFVPVSGGIPFFEPFSRRGSALSAVSRGSSGVLVLQTIWLPGGRALTKVCLLGSGALAWGSGWTGQHFIYGIFDPDGNLFAQTNDTGGTAVFTSSFSPQTITKDGSGSAISSAVVPRSGLCMIGLLINSGTGGTAFTYPTFSGVTNLMGGVAPVLCATVGSGLTALPSSTAGLAGVGSEIYGGAG